MGGFLALREISCVKLDCGMGLGRRTSEEWTVNCVHAGCEGALASYEVNDGVVSSTCAQQASEGATKFLKRGKAMNVNES